MGRDDDPSDFSEDDCIPAVEILNYDLINAGLKKLYEPEVKPTPAKQPSPLPSKSSHDDNLQKNSKNVVTPKENTLKIEEEDESDVKIRYKIGYLPPPESDSNEKQVAYDDHNHFLKHASIKSKNVRSTSIRNVLVSPETKEDDNDDISLNFQSNKNDVVMPQSFHEPIGVAIAECIRTVVIPTFESMNGDIMAKIRDQIETLATTFSTEQHRSDGIARKEIESLSKQLTTMTQLVTKLTDEVQNLRRDVAAVKTMQSTLASRSSFSDDLDSKDPDECDIVRSRNEILANLDERDYEAAFSKASAASNVEILIFCCRNADLSEVLGGKSSHISQPTLLCLLERLGTVILESQTSSLQLEMEWLQEITLGLNPKDESIQDQVQHIVRQVDEDLNQKLDDIQGSDQKQLRRQIQITLQLLRSLPVGGNVKQ